MKKKDY